MRGIPPRHTRAVIAALWLFASLAACGRGDAERGAAADSAAQAPAHAAAADSAAADTSAMGIARRVLGPGVRMAIRFDLPGRDRRFIAAALPVTAWIDDPVRAGNRVAPGGHEMVVLELRGEGHAIQKPGLYASREPFLPPQDDTTAAPPDSAVLSRALGVEDANGDGDPEVWAAQFAPGSTAHTWDVRAFDRGGPTLYQLVARGTPGAGLDPASFQFSETVGEDAALRRWLSGKAQALEARRAAAGGGAGGRP